MSFLLNVWYKKKQKQKKEKKRKERKKKEKKVLIPFIS